MQLQGSMYLLFVIVYKIFIKSIKAYNLFYFKCAYYDPLISICR